MYKLTEKWLFRDKITPDFFIFFSFFLTKMPSFFFYKNNFSLKLICKLLKR